jgi:two-component system phosphate regulon response regulator PhoB
MAVKKNMHKPSWSHSQQSAILSRLSNAAPPRLGWCKWRVRKPSALVVDDDPSIPPLVELALGRYDISSGSVNDGDSAIAQLRAVSYDLVILDLAMGGTTGFDVLLSLKKETRLREIPVIVLTGNNSDEALARSFGYGADDFVLKPFKANELGMRAYRLLYPLTSR